MMGLRYDCNSDMIVLEKGVLTPRRRQIMYPAKWLIYEIRIGQMVVQVFQSGGYIIHSEWCGLHHSVQTPRDPLIWASLTALRCRLDGSFSREAFTYCGVSITIGCQCLHYRLPLMPHSQPVFFATNDLLNMAHRIIVAPRIPDLRMDAKGKEHFFVS